MPKDKTRAWNMGPQYERRLVIQPGSTVEIVSIQPVRLSAAPGYTTFNVIVRVDGVLSAVPRTAKDELEVMRWLMKLQERADGTSETQG